MERHSQGTSAEKCSRNSTVYSHPSQSLLCVLCCLSLTSCTAEQTCSDLKRLKACLRSSIHTETLSGLALTRVRRDLATDMDIIIDRLRRHPRRMRMANALLMRLMIVERKGTQKPGFDVYKMGIDYADSVTSYYQDIRP